MRPWSKRLACTCVLMSFLTVAVHGVTTGDGMYSALLDARVPFLRPLGDGIDRAYSFMMPTSVLLGMVGLAATNPSSTPDYKIIIDPAERTLTLFIVEDSGQAHKLQQYPVAVGKSSTPTPVGEWTIIDKGLNWGGGFGTRWLGLNVPWGIYGIHGTNKPHQIGGHFSAGCIRMFNGDVEDLFKIVPVGTPVDIVGALPGVRVSRALKAGSTGKDVQVLQSALRTRGLDSGRLDGRLGPQTEGALRQFELFYELHVDGIADDDVLVLLNLR